MGWADIVDISPSPSIKLFRNVKGIAALISPSLWFSFSLLRLSLGALNLNYSSCESTSQENSQAMDPKLKEVSQLFDRFKASFIRNDFDTCSNLLSQLKVFPTPPNPSLLISLISKIRPPFSLFLLFEDRFCCFI